MGLTPKFFWKMSLVLICVIAGCTVPIKQAIYMDPGFQSRVINQIILLPALDARIDKQTEVDIQKQIREAGLKIMNNKGYKVSLSDDMGEVIQIMEDDLKSGDPKWIKRLGPPEARYVMVLMLLDVTSKLTFGSTGNAEVAGFIYDKETGTIVWRDKGIGQAGQGGLVGMLFKGSMAGWAIENAIQGLLASIPDRP